MKFIIISKDGKSKSRAGRLITPHGVVETPAFVPVGTKATVKGLTPRDLKECGVQILFGNTYHLHLRPGEDVVQKFGGLGKFMGWDGVTITDSGGFQVFSLGRRGKTRNQTPNNAEGENQRIDQPESAARLIKIDEQGVTFQSPINGSTHTFTPEKSIEIQKKLGADIILAFDECPPYPSTYEYTKEATDRTHAWALRSLVAHKSTSSEVTRRRPRLLRGGPRQALYGIVQGGVYKNLREESARFIGGLDFDGIAIGGVAVGESKQQMRDVLSWVSPILPEGKPRHLLGIGEIDDIFDAISAGMDTFDCVMPTRMGRMGFVLVSPPEGNLRNRFRIDIQKSKWQRSKLPLDQQCGCSVCQNFTRGYLNHLFRARELLAYRLATYHNVYFITHLIEEIRQAISCREFGKLRKQWLA